MGSTLRNLGMNFHMLNLLEDYADRDQAARALNITTRTLDRWTDVPGGIPSTRIGHRVYFRKGALQTWIMAQERQLPTPRRSAAR
jgi:excisionase family DNA binding protein